ncbi:hypothetical protein G3I40_27895 [Streptomyces sp. SID14478]|uniref:hypothetical protein n=1 Tax=Streptomyces sp. SID14478 TaxID=2706073 RepID=UPI0013DB7559|nr:hypothetical protein [Streptomyces sp. SID14478]NEB79012.1 hypothetical protein [Streptomyces sp. SID14478]
MNVLFLALDASRARTTCAEAAQVVRDGGRAVVLIEQATRWADHLITPGVQRIETDVLEMRHWVRRWEWQLLFGLPRALARAIGRGPLRPLLHATETAYEGVLAGPLHRRVFLPVYRRAWGSGNPEMIRHFVRRDGPFDLIVVCDPTSLPVAASLAEDGAPAVAFRLN